MKKLLILSAALVLLLVACATNSSPAPEPAQSSQTTEQSTMSEAPAEPPAMETADMTEMSSDQGVASDMTAMGKPMQSAEEMDHASQDIVDLAVADGRFTTLVAAVEAAGLVDTLKGEGPFTVFAPTDEAFAKLPEGTVESLLADTPALTEVLLYHVVPGAVKAADVATLESADTALEQPVSIAVSGDEVRINDSLVLITDIEASNGVIHVIDTVLLPTKEEMAMAPADNMAEMMAPDIVDLAVADGRFTTLVAAVEAAGLADTLKSDGPFTVFAPTDEAFAQLPEGTVEALLADTSALTEILLYHVVLGAVKAADVVTLESADTALEQQINISVSGSEVRINDSLVLTTDIEASNGVIHVIDTVLLPPAAQ